ncbi:MAG: hypothetical protein NQU46_00070 [Methanolinea sp.]|nr:hypothetical protein [Methanolinea sp.]
MTVREGLVIGFGEFWHFYLYSSLFLATAAVGMAFVSCSLQGLDFSLTIATVLSLVVFSVYTMNRKTDQAEDSLNHVDRFKVTSRYTSLLFPCAIGAYALAMGLSALHGFLALAACSVPLVAGIFYSIPLLPETCRYRRLKDPPRQEPRSLVLLGPFVLGHPRCSLRDPRRRKDAHCVLLHLFLDYHCIDPAGYQGPCR